MIADLRTALNDALRRLSPKSVTAKAIIYGTKRWTALTGFLDDGRLEIDNNVAERSLRGIAIGRRNLLFAGSRFGGERAVAVLGQPLRNNNGTRFLLGGNFDLGKLVRGTIGIGYENHQYDFSFYKPIKGIAVDAQLQWLPTELTTVNLNATRKVEDAISANSPGYFASLAQLRVDHELLRYVVLFAEGNYENDKFVAIDRHDRQYFGHAGATYSIGRHFKLLPSAWYIVRDSNGAQQGPSFKEVRGTVELFTQW